MSSADKIMEILVKRIIEGTKEAAKKESQATLAKRMRVSQATVSHWVQGLRGPGIKLETALRALEALEGRASYKYLELIMNNKDAADLIKVISDHEDILKMFLAIMRNPNSPKFKKCVQDLSYLTADLDPQEKK